MTKSSESNHSRRSSSSKSGVVSGTILFIGGRFFIGVQEACRFGCDLANVSVSEYKCRRLRAGSKSSASRYRCRPDEIPRRRLSSQTSSRMSELEEWNSRIVGHWPASRVEWYQRKRRHFASLHEIHTFRRTFREQPG